MLAGKGKLVVLKLVKKDPSNDVFRQLGRSWELDGDLFKNLEQFTCTKPKGKISQFANTVNELRYQLFCAKKGEAKSSKLPPCRDCLFLHAQRAIYQAVIWKCCLDAKPVISIPTEHVWTESGCDQHQALRCYWSYWLPSVVGPASCLTACVLQMGSHAPTCASSRPAPTKLWSSRIQILSQTLRSSSKETLNHVHQSRHSSC